MSKKLPTILDLLPHMRITYGFTRFNVAEALARFTHESTRPECLRMTSAGRIIKNGIAADFICTPTHFSGRYYKYKETD